MSEELSAGYHAYIRARRAAGQVVLLWTCPTALAVFVLVVWAVGIPWPIHLGEPILQLIVIVVVWAVFLFQIPIFLGVPLRSRMMRAALAELEGVAHDDLLMAEECARIGMGGYYIWLDVPVVLAVLEAKRRAGQEERVGELEQNWRGN